MATLGYEKAQGEGEDLLFQPPGGSRQRSEVREAWGYQDVHCAVASETNGVFSDLWVS